MVYTSRKTQYTVVAVVSRNDTNDCYIAKRAGAEDGSQYTLIRIKDHETIRNFLEMYRRAGDSKGGPLQDSFSSGNDYMLVFPFRAERPLKDFFQGDDKTLSEVEEICINLVLACISSGVPFPLLYLILNQGKLNISRDGSIYPGYAVDLSQLDIKKGERDCAVECAQILLTLLEVKAEEKNISYTLLTKRTENRSYERFTELYRDLSIASAPTYKGNLLQRIRSFFIRNADMLFGILFWICLILAIVALCLLLSHTFVGDVPWLRLFFNSFKKIGTESMLQ